LSYSTQDASWTTWSTQFQIKNWMGRTGSIVADILFQTFGLWSFSIIGIFFNSSRNGRREFSLKKFFHTALFLFAGCLALQTFWTSQFVPWKLSRVGGIFGSLLYECSHFLFSHYGTILFSIVFFLTTTLLLFEISITENAKKASASLSVLFKKIKFQIQLKRTHLKAKQEAAVVEIEPAAEVLEEEVLAFEPDEENGISVDKEFIAEKKVIPKRKTKNFSLPQLNLLSGKAENKVKTVDKNWYIEKSQILVQKLKDFGVEGEVVHISPGPVITVYEFKPASGVKIKDIANLSDDLTLALSVLSVRIVAPIPGKPVVGIEIPSPHREMVYFKDLIQETHFFDGGLKIPILLGRSASGEPIATDLSQMPHLLIAGTTGTGKSVFINTLICSLLYRFTPKELKLILVDPKMVELSHYEGIPHLLLPVVVDYKKAVLALRWTVEDRRAYKVLATRRYR
jgi:S-DNA-T family DNA segregation ATPase FtsK/SpoIIIE